MRDYSTRIPTCHVEIKDHQLTITKQLNRLDFYDYGEEFLSAPYRGESPFSHQPGRMLFFN